MCTYLLQRHERPERTESGRRRARPILSGGIAVDAGGAIQLTIEKSCRFHCLVFEIQAEQTYRASAIVGGFLEWKRPADRQTDCRIYPFRWGSNPIYL